MHNDSFQSSSNCNRKTIIISTFLAPLQSDFCFNLFFPNVGEQPSNSSTCELSFKWQNLVVFTSLITIPFRLAALRMFPGGDSYQRADFNDIDGCFLSSMSSFTYNCSGPFNLYILVKIVYVGCCYHC